MGPEEEDGVLVGGRFDSSFWKLINLKDREGDAVIIYIFIDSRVVQSWMLKSIMGPLNDMNHRCMTAGFCPAHTCNTSS